MNFRLMSDVNICLYFTTADLRSLLICSTCKKCRTSEFFTLNRLTDQNYKHRKNWFLLSQGNQNNNNGKSNFVGERKTVTKCDCF